jgi:hypothetical protein
MGYPLGPNEPGPMWPPVLPLPASGGNLLPIRLHPFVNVTEIHWPKDRRKVCYGWWQCGCGQTNQIVPEVASQQIAAALSLSSGYFYNWVWETAEGIGFGPCDGANGPLPGITCWHYKVIVWEPPLGLLFLGSCKDRNGNLYRTSKGVEYAYPPYRPHEITLDDPKPKFGEMPGDCACPSIITHPTPGLISGVDPAVIRSVVRAVMGLGYN